VATRAKHAVERLGVLHQRLRILPQHLADADNGVERRAQFVAHVGKKMGQVSACLFRSNAPTLDFVLLRDLV